MKRLCSVTVGMVMLLGLAAPAQATPVPHRSPLMLLGATTYVYPRTTYTIGCMDFGAAFYRVPATMSMVGYTLSDLKGRKITSNVVVTDRLRSEYITASASGTSVTQVTTPAPSANPSNFISSYTIKPKAVGILRVGTASWDGVVLCSVAQGSSFSGIGLSQQPSAQGRFMYPSDLGSGVGVGTGSGSVAALQSYSHKTNGYLFSIFRPDMGAAKITDPKGKVRYDSVTNPSRSVMIAEPSKGSWTFSLDANATRSRSPALWVLEIR